jgi:Uma2 family endonuclease
MGKDDFFERWWAAMPERKLELIDGRLIIGTLAGSRRVTWNLLYDHGPAMALPMASSDLWWEALRQAFNPRPMPQTPEEWAAWAAIFQHNPEPPPAGPHDSLAHRRTHELLKLGLYRFDELSGLGRSLGRDFVVHLGENGLTPDLLFADSSRLANLHDYYLDGPPSIVIEITLEGGEEQESGLKLRLYEEAKVPEYWLIEAASQQALFFCLGADSRYHRADVDSEGIYHSTAVPGLALSLPHLWTMKKTDWDRPSLPFLPPVHRVERPASERQRDPGELRWDSLPFAPRVGLQPMSIRFDEFISWCPEAKFEDLGGGLLIGGSEGARRCLGLLLMTFGLVEAVKLATPREWVTFLHQEAYEPLVQEHTEALMAHAEYRPSSAGEEFVYATIPELPGVSAAGDDRDECRRELSQEVRNLVLLRIARELSPSEAQRGSAS